MMPSKIGKAAIILAVVAAGVSPVNAAPVIEKGDWQRMGQQENVELYLASEAPATYARAWRRIEAAEPVSLGPISYRSAKVLVEMDCARGEARTVMSIFYGENNLGGQPIGTASPTDSWSKPKAGLTQDTFDYVCKMETAVEAADRAQGRIPFREETIAANARFKGVEDGSWPAFVPLGDVKPYFRAGGLPVDGYPVVETRLEYARPKQVGGATAMSSWHLTQIDCLSIRYRHLETETYDKPNLDGDPKQPKANRQWLAMDGVFSNFKRLCDRKMG